MDLKETAVGKIFDFVDGVIGVFSLHQEPFNLVAHGTTAGIGKEFIICFSDRMNYFCTDAALIADAGKGDLRGGFAVSDDAFGQYPFAFVIFSKEIPCLRGKPPRLRTV